MNKVLAIYGASGLGREVLELARIINDNRAIHSKQTQQTIQITQSTQSELTEPPEPTNKTLQTLQTKQWSEFIFIDDGDVPSVVSSCNVYKYDVAKSKYGSDLEIVMGIGEPLIRKKLFEKIKADNIPTPTLIHPDVYIPASTQIGHGVVIQWGSFISCNVSIEDYVYIQPQCNVGHDDVLAEGCTLSGFCNLGGIVHVGKWSYLALSVAVKQLITIGDHSIIGMGSVVHKDIPDNVIAMGNPARPVVKNDKERVFRG